MVRAHVVLIHRALDQAHAHRLRVEAVVLTDLRRDGGEMVDAGELQHVAHACSLSPCRSPRKSPAEGSSSRGTLHSIPIPLSADTTDAANTAILAAEKSAASGKASPAMNSDIVNPMPASAPAPASCRQVYAEGFSAMPSRTASADAPSSPSGLPTTSPITIAVMSGPCPPITAADSGTPALASANTGSTT